MHPNTAEVSRVRKDVKLPATRPRREAGIDLASGVSMVLDAAFGGAGSTDLRRGILTAVYNYDTESFEIRWDLAK